MVVVPVVPPEPVVVVVELPVGEVALREFQGCQTKSPIASSTTTMTATMIPVLLLDVLEEL
ncbi:MAG TPA: hypothetical protein VHT53_12510 [Candidatus Elarobacter sp.]|nr:hypothetical protein [Candidatus Elarobacter sp.]